MTEKITKPTLPRDVAEAIEKLKERLNMGELELLNIEVIRDRFKCGNDPLYGAILKYHDANRLDYIRAIINGYTIEQSQGEKLREYYTELESISNNCTFGDALGISYRGQKVGIEKALSILGIQIEGINIGGDS